MKKNLRRFFLGLFVFTLGVSGLAAAGSAVEDGAYYTKQNIWYEKPMKILSTNYHKGAILPVGSQVEILKRNKKKIKFRDQQTGTTFRLVLVKDYTALNEQEFFDRYFSNENVLKGAPYASFSEMEKENIQNGTLQKGMSKNAVLMAYGYPPSHQTPSIKGAMWTYWKSRLVHFMVQFKGDQIDSLDV